MTDQGSKPIRKRTAKKDLYEVPRAQAVTGRSIASKIASIKAVIAMQIIGAVPDADTDSDSDALAASTLCCSTSDSSSLSGLFSSLEPDASLPRHTSHLHP